MRDPRRLFGALLLLTMGLFVTACAGDGGSGGGAGGELKETLIDGIEEGKAVEGNFTVTWRNLDPRNKDVTISLVNESSEYGRRLKSGRSTSTITRVADDTQMGQLMATLTKIGFFVHATPMEMGALPEVSGRKGAVVVQRDGSSVGLMLVRSQGTAGSPIPRIYTDAKRLIMVLHGSLQGLEVRTNVDPDDVFRAPPIRMERQ